MMKMISLKCPECGADIDIEEGHKQCFCKYCGTKILIDDGNSTYTYRKVDEARIKEAEVDKAIRLKELEIEQEKNLQLEKTKELKTKFTIILCTIALISFIISYTTSSNLGYVGDWALIICVVMWKFGKKKRNKQL